MSALVLQVPLSEDVMTSSMKNSQSAQTFDAYVTSKRSSTSNTLPTPTRPPRPSRVAPPPPSKTATSATLPPRVATTEHAATPSPASTDLRKAVQLRANERKVDQSSSSSLNSLSSGSTSNSDPVMRASDASSRTASKRHSLARRNAFNRSSTTLRGAPPRPATDQQTITAARTAFIESDVIAKPALNSGDGSARSSFVSHSLEDFDPLLTGQLICDEPVSGENVSENGSVTSLSRKSTDEDLLKDWSLDFAQKKASNTVSLQTSSLPQRYARPWSAAPVGFVRKQSQVCNERDVVAAHQQHVISGSLSQQPPASLSMTSQGTGSVFGGRSREGSPAAVGGLGMKTAPIAQRIAVLQSRNHASHAPSLPTSAPPPLPKTAPPSQDPFSDLLADATLLGMLPAASNSVASSFPVVSSHSPLNSFSASSVSSCSSIGASRFARGMSPSASPGSVVGAAQVSVAGGQVSSSSSASGFDSLNARHTQNISSSQLAWEKFE